MYIFFVFWGLLSVMAGETLAEITRGATLRRRDAGWQMLGAGCLVQNAGCQMLDAGCQMPDAGSQIPDAG